MLPRTKVIVACIVIFIALIVVDQWRKHSSDETTEAAHQEQGPSESAMAQMPTGEWKEFSPQNGAFKVMLPALPQHASETVPFPTGIGVIKYDMYFSQEKDGTTYMISLIQYPDSYDTANADDLLSNTMKEMVAGSANNKLVNSQKGIFQNVPALDFAINNSDVTIRCKTFLVGKTLFVLTLSDRTTNNYEAMFNKFINSFQLGDAMKAAASNLPVVPK